MHKLIADFVFLAKAIYNHIATTNAWFKRPCIAIHSSVGALKLLALIRLKNIKIENMDIKFQPSCETSI